MTMCGNGVLRQAGAPAPSTPPYTLHTSTSHIPNLHNQRIPTHPTTQADQHALQLDMEGWHAAHTAVADTLDTAGQQLVVPTLAEVQAVEAEQKRHNDLLQVQGAGFRGKLRKSGGD